MPNWRHFAKSGHTGCSLPATKTKNEFPINYGERRLQTRSALDLATTKSTLKGGGGCFVLICKWTFCQKVETTAKKPILANTPLKVILAKKLRTPIGR